VRRSDRRMRALTDSGALFASESTCAVIVSKFVSAPRVVAVALSHSGMDVLADR